MSTKYSMKYGTKEPHFLIKFKVFVILDRGILICIFNRIFSILDAERYSVKPACTRLCRQECLFYITEERRQEINKTFWTLSKLQQKEFILSRTTREKCNKQIRSRRHVTYRYHLDRSNGDQTRVCKHFFLGTLGFNPGNDRFIKNIFNSVK